MILYLCEEKKQAKFWLRHQHYPFVPTVIQNVLLNVQYSQVCKALTKKLLEIAGYYCTKSLANTLKA